MPVLGPSLPFAGGPFYLAGRYGPEAMLDGLGQLLKNMEVFVYQPGTTTLATVWADKHKVGVLSNPVTTTDIGDLIFYAEPGDYDIALDIGGVAQPTLTVTVEPDPTELSSGGPGPTGPEGPTGPQGPPGSGGGGSGAVEGVKFENLSDLSPAFPLSFNPSMSHGFGAGFPASLVESTPGSGVFNTVHFDVSGSFDVVINAELQQSSTADGRAVINLGGTVLTNGTNVISNGRAGIMPVRPTAGDGLMETLFHLPSFQAASGDTLTVGVTPVLAAGTITVKAGFGIAVVQIG